MTKLPEDPLHHIRVHEAGHAVAHYLLGYEIECVVTGDEKTGFTHRCRVGAGFIKRGRKGRETSFPRTLIWPFPRARAWKRQTIINLAGLIAEIYFFGETDELDGSEVKILNELDERFHHIAPQTEASIAIIEWFAKPEYMDAVEAVANGLKTNPLMSGPEAEKIIQSTGLKPLNKTK